MQKRVLIMLISMVLCSCSILAQQQHTNTEEQKLLKEISRKLFIPRDIDTTCKSIFTVVTISVRQGKVSDSLTFDPLCPPSLQKSFSRTIGIFKSAKWSEIFAEVKDLQDYDIVLPFGYLFQVDGCYDTSLSQNDIYQKARAIEKDKKGQTRPTYQLKPVIKKFLHRVS